MSILNRNIKELLVNLLNALQIFINNSASVWNQTVIIYFIGRLNNPLNSSILGLGYSWLNVTTIFPLFGSAYFVLALVAQEYGKKNYALISSLFYKALLINLLTAVAIIVINQFCEFYFELIRMPSDIAKGSAEFIRIGTFWAIPQAILAVMISFLTSVLRLNEIIISSFISFAVNLILSYFFIYYQGYGIEIAPYLLIIVYVIQAISLGLLMIFTKDSIIRQILHRPGKDVFKFFWTSYFSAVKTAIYNIAECSAWEINVLISTYLGPVSLTAFTLMGMLEVIGWMISNSLAQAVCMKIAESLGSGNQYIIRKNIKIAYIYGITGLILYGTFTYTSKFYLPQFFFPEEDVQEVLEKNMLYLTIVVMADMMQLISGNIIRSFGWFTSSMVASLLGFYLFGIPCVFVFVYFERYGIAGLLFGFTVGLIAVNTFYIILLCRFNMNKEIQRVQDQMADPDVLSMSFDARETSLALSLQEQHPVQIGLASKNPEAQIQF